MLIPCYVVMSGRPSRKVFTGQEHLARPKNQSHVPRQAQVEVSLSEHEPSDCKVRATHQDSTEHKPSERLSNVVHYYERDQRSKYAAEQGTPSCLEQIVQVYRRPAHAPAEMWH